MLILLSNYTIDMSCTFDNVNHVLPVDFTKHGPSIMNSVFTSDELEYMRKNELFNYSHKCGFELEEIEQN